MFVLCTDCELAVDSVDKIDGTVDAITGDVEIEDSSVKTSVMISVLKSEENELAAVVVPTDSCRLVEENDIGVETPEDGWLVLLEYGTDTEGENEMLEIEDRSVLSRETLAGIVVCEPKAGKVKVDRLAVVRPDNDKVSELVNDGSKEEVRTPKELRERAIVEVG